MGGRCCATFWISCSRPAWLALALAVAVGAGDAAAQSVRVEGTSTDPAALAISRIVDRGAYTLIDRDTTLDRSVLIEGDLIVARGEVRLEGRVTGAVAVLGGELFVRPGATIEGPIAVARGGVHPSAHANVGPILTIPFETAVEVEHEPGGYALRLTPPPRPRALRPEGVFGVALPVYDRVNGLTVGGSARLLLAGAREGAFAHAAASYHSARQAFGGRLGVEAPVSRGVWLFAEAFRGPVTNERWIRGDLPNTLAAATLGSDARDYHESDAVSVGVVRRPVQPLIGGESFFGPRLVLRASRDRSLESADPWSLFGGEWRANPPIADGEVISALAGAALAWEGATVSFAGDAALEWAPGGLGDFEFAQAVIEGDLTMLSLWAHEIEVYARTMLAMGGSGAPPQRWSFVGGANTLPTFQYGALRGDNLFFVRSVYSAPIPVIELPFLGMPALRLVQATGTAWVTDQESPRWEQNLGIGLGFSVLEAMAYVDPAADALEPTFSLGLHLPF